MRAGWNRYLRDWLWATDPKAALMVEAVTVEAENTKDLRSEWEQADTFVGVVGVDRGGLQLENSSVAQMEYTDTPDANIETLAPTFPHTAVFIEWGTPAGADAQIETVLFKVNPRITGAAREVTKWVCRAYRVKEVGPALNRFVAEYLGEQSVVEAGSVVHDITFNFVQDGRGALVGDPPQRWVDIEGRTSELDPPGHPVTMLVVSALKANGDVAGNCGIRAKAGAGPTQTDGLNWSAQVQLVTDVDTAESAESNAGTGGAWFKTTLDTAFPYIQINQSSYAPATATYTNHPIDLGHAPVADVVVIAQGEEDADSSLLWEISDDGGANWYPCADGDIVGQNNPGSGNNLSAVARQQTYAVRVTLTPSSSGTKTPVARRFGVEDIRSTDLSGAAVVEAYTCGVDPYTLKSEVSQLTIKILKTGERDYRDYFTAIMSSHHIGQVQMRVLVGHPDLERRFWLHIDTFDVEDLIPGDSYGAVVCLSVLGRLRTIGTIPRWDSGTNKRTPLEYPAGTAISDIYDDLLDSAIALPGRLRGAGLPVTITDTASNFIRESDGKDALEQVAYLACHSLIASQGKVKAMQMMEDQGEERPKVVSFPREACKPINLSPGFTRRIDEFFVKTGWDETLGEWAGPECYAAWVAGLDEKLRSRGVESRGELDDETCRWIDNTTLGNKVAKRVVDHFCTGMMLWEIDSTYAHPYLEPGDVVTVTTDQYVGMSPITDKPIRGVVSAKGVIAQVLDPMGRRFVVWVKSITDVVVTEESVTRIGFVKPEILQGKLEFGTDGSLIGRFQGNAGVGSIRAVDDGTAFQSEATTRAATAVAVDADGWVQITLAAAGTYDLLDLAYVTAFGYETATGTGAESPVLFKLKEQSQNDADSDAEVTGLTGGFTDDGYALATAIIDDDGAAGRVYFTVGLGSAPADPTPGANDGYVDPSGARSVTVVFDGSGVTTAKQADMGQLVYFKARARNGAGVLFSKTVEIKRRRGDTKFVPPRVSYEAYRSGTTVTVVVAVDDPSLSVTAIEFNKRPGTEGASLGGWVSSWDSTSGTIGSSTALSRTEAVTSEGGVDGEFLGRVGYYDEKGAAKTKEFSINLANLQDLSGDFEISFGALLSIINLSSIPNPYINVAGELYSAIDGVGFPAGSTTRMIGALQIPKGVTVTECESVLRRDTSGAAADVVFRYRSAGTGGTVNDIHTLTCPSGGLAVVNSGAITHTVVDGAYFISADLKSDPASLTGDEASFVSFRVKYTRPSLKKVI